MIEGRRMFNLVRNIAAGLVSHDGIRRYGINAFWLVSEKAVRLVFGLLVGVYVARQLDPTGYGELNYALSFTAVFSVLAGLGVNDVVLRELIRSPEREGVLLGSCAGIRFGGFLLMIGIFAGILFLSGGMSGEFSLVFIIGCGYLFQVFQGIELCFQARLMAKYSVWSQVGALVFCAFLRVYGAWKRFPLEFFASVEVVYMGLCAAGYGFFYWKNGAVRWTFSRSTALRLLREGWPLALSAFAVLIQMQFDQVLLKSLKSSAEVGIYSVAVRWVALWYFVPVTLGSALFPAIVRAREISMTLYIRRLRQFFSLMTWCGVGFVVVSVGMSFLVVPLYGEAYREAGWLMRFYALGLIPVFFGSARTRWLTAGRRIFDLSACSAGGAVCSVALNLLLIPSYGAFGCCIASVCSFVFGFMVMPFFFRKRALHSMLLKRVWREPFDRDFFREWRVADGRRCSK